MYLKLGALLGDNWVYNDITTTCPALPLRMQENEFPFEKEDRDRKYIESRENNKSLSVFE